MMLRWKMTDHLEYDSSMARIQHQMLDKDYDDDIAWLNKTVRWRVFHINPTHHSRHVPHIYPSQVTQIIQQIFTIIQVILGRRNVNWVELTNKMSEIGFQRKIKSEIHIWYSIHLLMSWVAYLNDGMFSWNMIIDLSQVLDGRNGWTHHVFSWRYWTT